MPIPRLHLFEFEDLRWFPTVVRDLATDYLRFMEHRLQLHRPVVPLLKHLLVEVQCRDVIDLCSGGAGPGPAVQEALASEGISARFTLTDLYPNVEAFERAAFQSGGAISFIRESIDARAVLRAYTVTELEELANEFSGSGYVWNAGKVPVPSSKAHLTYLMGYPSRGTRSAS